MWSEFTQMENNPVWVALFPNNLFKRTFWGNKVNRATSFVGTAHTVICSLIVLHSE